MPATDPVGRWALTASSVAGRPVPLVPTGEGPVFSDGTGLHLPPAFPAEAVLVQAAMLAAGSFTPLGVRLLAGRRGSADRYLALEARRAVHLLADLLPAALVARAAALHSGSVSLSAEDSLERARSSRIPGAPDWCGTIRPLRLRSGAGGGGEVSDRDLRDAAQPGVGLDELDDVDPSGDGDRSRFLELLATPVSNPLATRLARMLGMGTAPGGSGEGGQEFGVGASRQSAGGGGRRHVAGAPPPGRGRPPARAHGRRYDEWCHRTGDYRRDWCTVTELLPDTGGDLVPAVGTDVALRRRLARLGLADARRRRQPDGHALDATALAEFAVARRLGHAGEPRPYEARRRTRRDLGVLVLLDASGSTGAVSGASPVFERQRELAGALTETLDRLGDRVATYAFYSRGRDQVRFLRVKEFDERYGRATRLRLAALTPGGYTRLGAAVRHATHLLTKRAGTAATLLVVIGDGLPYDDGYEHDHAREDTRRSLMEAVEQGVGCACLSMRAAGSPDAAAQLWGQFAHRNLERPRDLAAQVNPLFRYALVQAAASRRTTRAA